MVAIKAFVGHSFTSDDEAVVDKFLKYFDQLRLSLPDFQWVSARSAEPSELASKVLRLTKNCNTFIAVCTCKELVGSASSFSPRFFSAESLAVAKDAVAWKTSDWIIQEIGLAVGRGLSIIILLEENCRRPGGLQGDVEFIPFNRESPESSFLRILEMLGSLNPAAGAASPATTEDEPKPTEAPTSSADSSDDEPDDSWDAEKYESSFLWRLFRNKEDKADKISDAYIASPYLDDHRSLVEWKSKSERWRILWGKKGQLSVIRTLYSENQDNPRIIADYGAALSHYSQNAQSAQMYLEACKYSDDTADLRINKISAVYEFVSDGQLDQAFTILDQVRNESEGTPESQRAIAYCIRSIAQNLKDEQLEIEALERLASIDPDDQDNRFSLAFAHSKYGNEDLALNNYLLIPASSRTSAAWNNLGVSYQHFSVAGRSIEAYRRATGEGETLAMSNLAYKFMNAGFLDEAKSMLESAMGTSAPHRNVGEAYASLLDIPEKEKTQVAALQSEMKSKAALYERLSSAILRPNFYELGRVWVSPDCDLEVMLSNRKFSASGRYTVKSSGLGGILGGSTSSEYEVRFEGLVIGHRIFGEVERKPLKGATDSLFGALDRKKKFAIIFNGELTQANVTEDVGSRNPRTYTIAIKSDEVELR